MFYEIKIDNTFILDNFYHAYFPWSEMKLTKVHIKSKFETQNNIIFQLHKICSL